jgi:hypothetical protein
MTIQQRYSGVCRHVGVTTHSQESLRGCCCAHSGCCASLVCVELVSGLGDLSARAPSDSYLSSAGVRLIDEPLLRIGAEPPTEDARALN